MSAAGQTGRRRGKRIELRSVFPQSPFGRTSAVPWPGDGDPVPGFFLPWPVPPSRGLRHLVCQDERGVVVRVEAPVEPEALAALVLAAQGDLQRMSVPFVEQSGDELL